MKTIAAAVIVILALSQLALSAETVESVVQNSFVVEEWVSTTLIFSSNDTLTWKKMFPGETNQSADNNITVRVEVETNIVSDIYLKGDDFACTTPPKCGSDWFHISNLSACNTTYINDTGCSPWEINNSYGPTGGYYKSVPAPSGSPISKLLTFFLSTPGAQRAGSYQANLTIKTIKAGNSP